jgi:serine protease AprX
MTAVGRPPGAARSITWKGRTSAAVLVCMALGVGAGLTVDPASATGTPPPAKPAPKPSKVHGAGATTWGDVTSAQAKGALDASGAWVASRDRGSLSSIAAGYGIRAAWSKGVTGKGVTVAVIDTGIAPVQGLDAPGKVVNGPDLSFESQRAGTRYVDGYGHGTHLAGIIAGRDETFDPRKPKATTFAGVAPDAQLLNVKVGAADGGADVSQVIAALDWVVAHRSDNGMNVRVVNLAYGTKSTQAWQVDPLARAVENAWRAGLVVVTAAGNDGLDAPSLLMPALDPHVIAVGAVDNAGTTTHADDVVAGFTNGGSPSRRPDVLAPGKSVVSLRVPGSYVDALHPEGLVTGDSSGRFFRGSGTSQATAVASGEVALLLQARPRLTPDQVKAVLRSSADRLVKHPSPVMGAGVTDLPRALTARVPSTSAAAALTRSTGLGSLEASRGGEHVVDLVDGGVLTGEVDALGSPWDGAAWAAAQARGGAWDGGSWNGRVWTGEAWQPGGYAPAAWTGSSWSGVPWASHPWSEATWQARSWRDSSWAARSWREDSWEARSWREDAWSARSWRSLP